MIIKKEPKNLKALNNFANLKVNLNDLDGAINFYLRALEVSPKETNILFSLATSYQAIGNFEKAKEVAYKILKIDPKKTSAHKLISALSTYKERNEEKLRVMEKLSQEDLSENQKIDLFYALGKAYEDLKDYKILGNALEKANFIKRKTVKYEIKNEEKVFNNIIKAFDQIDLNEFKKIPNQKRIIFICGMPRSGTTLTEQIIAAHNKVNGAGELIYLQNVIKHNFFDDLNLKKQKIIEEGLGSKNTLENDYLKFLDLHKLSSEIITDKAPQNFYWIGFIKLFFPNSIIINTERKIKDNAFSIFKNAFSIKRYGLVT